MGRIMKKEYVVIPVSKTNLERLNKGNFGYVRSYGKNYKMDPFTSDPIAEAKAKLRKKFNEAMKKLELSGKKKKSKRTYTKRNAQYWEAVSAGTLDQAT